MVRHDCTVLYYTYTVLYYTILILYIYYTYTIRILYISYTYPILYTHTAVDGDGFANELVISRDW